ncbi:MAG: signal recognition particle-docking protein FtsY [Firmicutes bacterium]|nr:signal recognition particle-docking protein FtsY [Bacillota bacterium]
MEIARVGFFSKLKEGLAKTRNGLVAKIENLFQGQSEITEELYEDLEAILVQADLGVDAALNLVETLRERVKAERIKEARRLTEILKEELKELIGEPGKLAKNPEGPTVVMVVGVNGTGKTTSTGKLAYHLVGEGNKVLLGAADTFRAAAIEQLEIWGERSRASVIKHQMGSDPAAVAYDAVQAGLSRGSDYILIDTAGRLHTQTNLMQELEKIGRVIGRAMPGAPHEILLVIDATTGQNALSQAKLFSKAVPITGIILTKLDGTAKGGIVAAVADTLKVPVKFIGLGEGPDDLKPFDTDSFVEALFERD